MAASRPTLAATLLVVLTAAPLLARPVPLPSDDELRQLQRHTFDCGRENSAEPCRQARSQADPLLDHPRLSGSCKDVLWTIREQAVVVATNSVERRNRLNRAGADVTVLCRPQAQPVRPSTTPPPGGEQRRGFGLIPSS